MLQSRRTAGEYSRRIFLDQHRRELPFFPGAAGRPRDIPLNRHRRQQALYGKTGLGDGNEAVAGTDETTISLMVGDLQRLRVYAEMGFQAPVEVPDEIWSAYDRLVAAGYDQYVIK